MLAVCQALLIVMAYVRAVSAVASTDLANPPRAIYINANVLAENGPVYVPAGSNITILGISAYPNDDNFVGGLGKVTVNYEPFASENIMNIQLNDKRAGVVEYAKANSLLTNTLLPQVIPPFYPSPMFHLLFHGRDRAGSLKQLVRPAPEFTMRWKASSCSTKPTDPATREPYVNQCFNYTLTGARGEDSGWPAFLLLPNGDFSDSPDQRAKNQPASLRLGPEIRVIEAPQQVEWLTPRDSYPYLLNANATLDCRVVAAWREEFTVQVLLVSPDGKQLDITSLFQYVNVTNSTHYMNATIWGNVSPQAQGVAQFQGIVNPGVGGAYTLNSTNSSAFVRRRHVLHLRATRVLDASMDNKTFVCQAVSKHFPWINASDSLFFRLQPNQSALLAYHSNRSSDMFNKCPSPQNFSDNISKSDSYYWRCCVEVGGSGNADELLYGNRDKNLFGFQMTDTKKARSAFVNTPRGMLDFDASITFVEPHIEHGSASRVCFALHYKSPKYSRDIAFTFGLRHSTSDKWHNTTSYQQSSPVDQKDVAYAQTTSGAASGELMPLAAALALALLAAAIGY